MYLLILMAGCGNCKLFLRVSLLLGSGIFISPRGFDFTNVKSLNQRFCVKHFNLCKTKF